MTSQRGRTGFSITELLVVVAVITILATLIVIGTNLAYSNAMRLKCQHRLEQIGQACQMYASANHGVRPAAWDFYAARAWHDTLAYGGWLTSPEIVTCPIAEELTDPEDTAPVYDPVPADVRDAILKALRWLKANQEGDGSWPTGAGTYMAGRDDGITGLGLTCFLGYGCTIDIPAEFKDTVRTGLEYLTAAQGVYGSEWWRSHHPSYGWWGASNMYETGIGAIVMSDAWKIMGDRTLETTAGTKTLSNAAERAVAYFIDVQSGTTGAFGYGGGGTDTSVTGWVTQGIWSARRAGVGSVTSLDPGLEKWLKLSICVNRFACVSGLYVCSKCGYIGPCPSDNYCPTEGCDGSRYNGWLKLCTWSVDSSTPTADGKCPLCHGPAEVVPDDYRAPYQMNSYGGPHTGLRGTISGDRRLTAMSLAARAMMGHTPSATAALNTPGRNIYEQLQWMKSESQYLSVAASGTDLYLLYYVTVAFSILGGDDWTEWKDTLVEPLLAQQKEDGTWPASLACFGSSDCPVYPTALALACLEFLFADELGNAKASQKVTGLSYGYNPDLGEEGRTPGGDTIMVMDYTLSIFRKDDPRTYISPRHGGRANALMGDGAVRALDPEEITDGMWTLDPGD